LFGHGLVSRSDSLVATKARFKTHGSFLVAPFHVDLRCLNQIFVSTQVVCGREEANATSCLGIQLVRPRRAPVISGTSAKRAIILCPVQESLNLPWSDASG
jgi:hypothetical protein